MFEPQPQTLFPTSEQMADIGNAITPSPTPPLPGATATATPDSSAKALATADTLPPRETSSLDLTFGAPIPKESEAFAAYHALKQERKTPGTIPADRLPQLKATLKDYATIARAYNRPLFAEQTTIQRASQVRHTQKLLAGLDKLPEALSPEQVKALDERAKLHLDPDAYRARQINRTLLDMAYGKKVKPENYELARDHYAKNVLGSTTPLDDKAFYSAMQTRAQKQQGAEKLLSEKLDSLLSDTVAGKQWNIKTYLGEIKDAMPDINDTTLESMESELRLKRRQFTDLKRTVTPIAQALTDFTFARGDRADAIKYANTPGAAPMPQSEFEAAQRFMALTPEQRTMTAAMIAQELETMPEDQRPAPLRALLGAGRTTYNMVQGVADFIAANYYAGKQFLKDDARPEGDATVQGAGQLRQLSTKAAADMLRPSDGFLAKVGILATSQLPYMAAAASGAGTALLGASMAGDSYVQARTNRPDTDPNKQLMAATVSGAAQAVVERASFKVLTGAVKGTGKLTGFLTGKYGTESMLRLAGVTNKLARYAAGYTIGTAVITGTEYGEEVAQEFIDTGLQDLATTMSGIDPDTDYLALLKSWNPTGEKGVKTILALLPLAIIGGWGAGAHHFKHGEILLRNRSALTAVGIAPDRIEAIVSNPDVKQSEEQFREAFQEGASQKLDDAQRAEAAAQFESHLAGIKELAQQAGMEIIAEDTDFAEMGEDPRFVLRLPDQEPQLFNTREEAETALRESIEQQIQESHDIALESLTLSMVDFLKSENQSGQNVQVNQKEFAGDFDTLIKKGLATREQVRARLELYAMESGLTMPQLQQKINSGEVDLRIMARAYSQQLTNGATKYFVDLFQGADPLSAAEDFSENHWQHLLSSGMVDAATAIGWLLEAQEKTGYQYLPAGFTASLMLAPAGEVKQDFDIKAYREKQRGALIEGLSKASVQYLLGQSQSEQLPAGFRGWLEKMVIAMGQAWTWAKQLMASTKLREAIENNQLPARFVAELADSVGLNDAARERRAEKEAEAQAMAEFLGDFTKLSEFAKGRLLHPAKAREMESPFAGELQRIYDHFVTRERKVKHTKKGVSVNYKDRVAAANKFFAPVDEAVNLDDLRQRMTEEGFPNMTTISDMLTQIEEVLSIEGLEIYATHSSLTAQNAAAGYGPTFSMAGTRAQIPQFMRDSLSAAQDMAADGKDSEAIRALTGWHPGKYDGKMRWEIPDNKAIIRGEGTAQELVDRYYPIAQQRDAKLLAPELQDILRHPALFDAYPSAKNIAILADAKTPYRGTFSPSMPGFRGPVITLNANLKGDEMRSTLLHEIQHFIQETEGFARGSSSEEFIEYDMEGLQAENEKYVSAMQSLIKRYKDEGKSPADAIASPQGKIISDSLIKIQDALRAPKEKYKRTAGEIEARDTQARRNLTPEQRMALAPYSSENIAPESAIVLYGQPVSLAEDPTFSLVDTGNGRLTAIHNLSDENLRFAHKMGGLAVPSVAIMPAGNIMQGFGEITLVGGLSIADPAKNPVFDADAYTARFPRPEYKKAKVADADKLVASLRAYDKKFENTIARLAFDNAVNYANPLDTLEKAKRSESAKAWFLETVHNITIEPVTKPANVEYPWVNHPKMQEAIEAGALGLDYNDTAGRLAFGKAIKEAIADHYSNLSASLKDRLIEGTTKRWLEEDGQSVFNTMALERSNNNIGKESIDTIATREKLDTALEGKESEFYTFLEDSILGIHGEPRVKVGSKLMPYTLENIVAAMTSGKIASKEDTMTFSEGKIRANNAQRFKSLESMRETAKKNIKTDEEVEQAREELDKRMGTWRETMMDFYKYSDKWQALDNSMEAIAKYLKGPRTFARMQKSLESLDFESVPKNMIDEAMEISELFMIAPVPYFESKPQRVVALNEFVGAIIPANASEETKKILESNGLPVVTYAQREERAQALNQLIESTPSATFSLSALTGSPLHTLLAQKAAAGPSERAEIMEGIRTRLQALEYKLEARGSGELTEMEKQLLGWRARTDLTPEQRERLRIEDSLAQVKAVLNAVPAEIRAKIAIPMTRILDAQTDKTTTNAFAELIENLDEELEFHLRGEYTEAISRILDIAQPTMSESRQSKGKLIVETNRLIAAINEALSLDALNLALELSTTEASITELERELESIPEEEAETRAKVQARLDATQERQFLLYHFGGIGSKDSRELAQSLKILRDAYTRGRIARQVLDQERRAWIARMRYDVRTSLDAPRGVTGPAHARATEKKNLAKGWAWNLMSIHNLLEVLFPYSQFAAEASQRLITAQRNVTRARLAAKDRFNAFMDETFGTTSQRQRNKIIRALHERRNWKTMIREVDGTKTEKLTIDQAQRILAGTLKPGWENEKDTMILLQQAWRDYLAKPKRAREATQFIEVSRVVSRKPAVALRLSDMDALYVLQLARQEEYIPALQTYGYTPEVLAEIRRDIDPRALEFMRFYGREYDENWSTMNPVFQELYHMDMPRIRNYAPGAFENMKSGAAMSGDPMGDAAPMGAMNFGATKNRRAHRSRPKQYSAHAVYMGHVDRSTYWVEFATIARDMGMIFRETETRRALEVKHGPEAAAELLTWLDNIANDGAIDAAARLASNTMAQNIAAGQAIAGLAFNLAVPFKQFGAALGALWFMSPAQAIRAFARALYRPETFSHVWKSEAVQHRIREGFSPEDRAMLDAADISPSELYRMHSISRLPTIFADAAFTTISGAIAYDHHYTESRAGGMDHARAHEAAMQFMDRVVFLTAQPADTQTKSNWEIQNKGFGKLLTLFKSDPRKQIGLLFADLAKAKAGNLSKAKLAERFLTQWMTYGLVAYVGGAAFRAIAQDDEDDRPVWDWKELLAAMLIGPVEGAGLFGSVIQAGIRLATGTRNFTNSNNPLSDSLLRTASTMKDFDITSMDTVKLLATITQLGSVKNPLWGLVPAAMRGIDQITNAMDNLSESDDERLDRLAREYNAQAKETAKAEARRIDDLATSATPLDQIPEEDRKKVEKKRNTATEEETAPPLIQSLKKMSERTRTEKINYILEGLPTEAERETFRAMLRTHGIEVPSP